MGYSSEHKTSSANWKEKIASAQANRNRRSRDNLKLENPFIQPYISRNNDHEKQGYNISKDDELAKNNMKNLPGYLRREEKKEKPQWKASGVLDYVRLENWKSKEKFIPSRANKKASSSTSKPPFVKREAQKLDAKNSDREPKTCQKDTNELRFSDRFSPEEPFSDWTSVTNSSSASESSMRSYQDLATKSTHPSPSRRFSFGLGKMTRSLSLKEDLGVPILSPTYISVNSGPLMSETSSNFEHLNKDNGNYSGKSRSSPLRRFLDPLLKPKWGHFAEAVQQGSKNEEFLQIKKQGSSSVQALLQVTMKNGIPFFKLVVDNSGEILAAAVKKLPTSAADDDLSLIYSFYSVREIKKKNGVWINQWSKEKSVDFDYNVVGQLKVSSSFDQYVVRESVLYSVDPGQADKKTPEFTSNRELAAIVVKDPSDENSCRDGQFGKSIIVVLPGGVHSVPIHGGPSPLMTRWRSGECDCGGWDIGCKLRVLTDSEMIEITRLSFPCSSADCLDLFYLDGQEGNKKSFSLAMVKNGLYSLDYDAPISLLQAFSICVAVITSQKLADIFEVPDQSEDKEEKKFPEAMTDNDRRKVPNKAHEEAPAKYVSYPPASPVRRV